jgi:2'-5' RNA ligase
MTRPPEWMTDRWGHRAEPAPGQGTVYWHMPMHDHPEVASLARDGQQRLANFGGLHMTPLHRLHITTLVAGPTADFSSAQLEQMAGTAASLLAQIPPITVTLGRVFYHPEAIVLAVSPGKALIPLRDAAITATRQATGRQEHPADAERWIPHVTICYSTARQPATPLINTLGEHLSRCEIQVDALSLIIQNGPERDWNWTTLATIPLT